MTPFNSTSEKPVTTFAPSTEPNCTSPIHIHRSLMSISRTPPTTARHTTAHPIPADSPTFWKPYKYTTKSSHHALARAPPCTREVFVAHVASAERPLDPPEHTQKLSFAKRRAHHLGLAINTEAALDWKLQYRMNLPTSAPSSQTRQHSAPSHAPSRHTHLEDGAERFLAERFLPSEMYVTSISTPPVPYLYHHRACYRYSNAPSELHYSRCTTHDRCIAQWAAELPWQHHQDAAQNAFLAPLDLLLDAIPPPDASPTHIITRSPARLGHECLPPSLAPRADPCYGKIPGRHPYPDTLPALGLTEDDLFRVTREFHSWDSAQPQPKPEAPPRLAPLHDSDEPFIPPVFPSVAPTILKNGPAFSSATLLRRCSSRCNAVEVIEPPPAPVMRVIELPELGECSTQLDNVLEGPPEIPGPLLFLSLKSPVTF